MQTTTITPNLWQLTRNLVIFPVNAYLVRETDSLTLIDTTIGGGAPAILAAAQQIGLPITRIVLTHAHMDHIGALDALHAALPQAEVIFAEREAPCLTRDFRLLPDEAQVPMKGSFPVITTRPTRTVQPDELIGSLRVVAAPGHTPGQIALLDTRDQSLIAGDAMQTFRRVAVAGTVTPLFPFMAMGTWHRPTALATARRLRDLHPARLAVGHGAVLNDPLPAMDVAITFAAQHVKEVSHVA